MEVIGSFFDVVYSLSQGVLILWPLGRDSCAGQCLTLLVTCPGLPVSTYKVIHSWWVPLLGLSVHWRGQAAY